MTENLSSSHYCVDRLLPVPFLSSCRTRLRAWLMLIFICAALLRLCSSPFKHNAAASACRLQLNIYLLWAAPAVPLICCSQPSNVNKVRLDQWIPLSWVRASPNPRQAGSPLYACDFTLTYANSHFVNQTANGTKCMFWPKFLVCWWWARGTKIQAEPPCGSVVFPLWQMQMMCSITQMKKLKWKQH